MGKLKASAMAAVVLGTLLITAGCGQSGSQGNSNALQNAVNSTGAQSTDNQKPVSGGAITVAIPAAPPTLDLQYSTDTAAREIGLHVYESLLTYDQKSNLIPQLASSWDVNKDSTVFTFHLRKGVLFQNGQEMTADDVKASFERFAKVSPRKKFLSVVKDYQVVDPYTFQITLQSSDPLFLDDLADPLPPVVIMPKQFADVPGGKLSNDQIVGTGPYQLADYVPGQYVTLKKFDKYVADTSHPASGLGGDRVAYLNQIKFVVVPEEASRLNGLETGEYQYAAGVSASEFGKISSSKTIQPSVLKPYFKIIATLNTLNGPLANAQLRQAIEMGIDDNAIMLAASGNKALFSADPSLFYPDQVWYPQNDSGYYNQDKVDQAKALIKQSGYNGQKIVLVTNKDYDFMYKAAIALQAQMQNLGLNVQMQVVDWPTASKMQTTPSQWSKWDINFTAFSLRFDPTGYDINFMSKYNFQPYHSSQMDQLFQSQLETADVQKRAAIYAQIQDLLLKDVPVLEFGDLYSLNAKSSKLQGEQPWYILRFWNTWLAQ